MAYTRVAVVVMLGAACATVPPTPAPKEDSLADAPVTVDSGGTPRQVTLLGPKAIFELLEKSERSYDLKEAPVDVTQWRQQNLSAMYPLETGLEAPYVEVKGTLRALRTWPINAELMAELQRIEPIYESGDYTRAEAEYEKLQPRFPNEFVLYLSLGDAALFGNHPDVALARYRRAAELNPFDHRAFYFLGNALLRLGRRAEAASAWITALALRPHWDPLREGLENAEQFSGLQLRQPFLPAGRVDAAGPGKFALLVGKHPAWIGWTMCKAAWLGEPEHRRAVLGREGRVSIEEERECLLDLLVMAENSKAAEDPVIEFIKQVHAAGDLDAMIWFELISREVPHITLLLPDEERQQIEGYVRRWVLVPKSLE